MTCKFLFIEPPIRNTISPQRPGIPVDEQGELGTAPKPHDNDGQRGPFSCRLMPSLVHRGLPDMADRLSL